MTILKKYNLQDIIKNIKKKNQNKFLSKKKLISGGGDGDNLEQILNSNSMDEINLIKKKELKNKFDETLSIFNESDFIIDTFQKLKILEIKYDKFNKKLKEMDELLIHNKTKFKISEEIYYFFSKDSFYKYYKEIITKYNKFYLGIDIKSDSDYKIYAYEKIYGNDDISYNDKYGEFTKLKDDFLNLKNKIIDNDSNTDGVKYYNILFLFINRIYIILIHEKFKQYKFFTFKNMICENLLISEKYNIIDEQIGDKINNINSSNNINIIGECVGNTIKEINIIKNYFKKYDEIIKYKIMNCEELDDVKIIKNDSYYDGTLFINKDNNIIFDEQIIKKYLIDNKNATDTTYKIKECARISYTFYYNIYNEKNFGNKDYYIGLIENIEPKFKIKTNIFPITTIQDKIDQKIEKFCYKYLYKSKINPIIDIIEDIEKNIEIIKKNIEEIYSENNYKKINKDDFDYKINLQECNYYFNIINKEPHSVGGEYLYSNENNDEKNIRDNAINIMREINNFVPIFTGGGGDNKTEKFIKDKVSLLEKNIKGLEEKIKKIKDSKNEYKDLTTYNYYIYFENTELNKLKDKSLESTDDMYKSNKKTHDEIDKLKIEFNMVTLELKKIIERNIATFLESKKLDEDIETRKKSKSDNSNDNNGEDDGDKEYNKGDKGDDANTGENETSSSDKKSTDFKIILDIFNMVFVVLIIIIYLIYISVCCISLLNIIIYIVMVIYDILMNIFNDDMTIYETFGYKILKYIDVQITYKQTDEDNTELLKTLGNTKEITDLGTDYKIIFNFMNLSDDKLLQKIKQAQPNSGGLTDENIKKKITDYKTVINNLREVINSKSPYINAEKTDFVIQFTDAKNQYTNYLTNSTDAGNYENFEKIENSDLNKEPYFFALIEQNIIYIITDFLTLILFLIIILFILYIFFTFGAYWMSKNLINGLNNNKTKKILIICSVFLIFITIAIVLYKYLFSDTIYEKLAVIKEKHNNIDRIIFSYLYSNSITGNINLDYCNDLKTNIGNIDIIDFYFKKNDSSGNYLDPVNAVELKKIKQQAFLYNLYLYLQEIVPTSNKSAISLIHAFFTASKDDNIRDSGYLSFASFLSNTSSANPIQKYYNNLGIFNDDTFINKKQYVGIKSSLNNQIKGINKELLTIPELKEALLLLGLYFLINLILNFIGLILISYLIAKDKDLAPDLRLFPEELSKFLANILFQIPYLNDLLYIYKDNE